MTRMPIVLAGKASITAVVAGALVVAAGAAAVVTLAILGSVSGTSTVGVAATVRLRGWLDRTSDDDDDDVIDDDDDDWGRSRSRFPSVL